MSAAPLALLVDDEADMRLLISTALEMTTPWRVRVSASRDEALAAVREVVPDAVILDFLMPTADGVTLLGDIRDIPGAAQIPAVILSGHDAPATPERLVELGVAGVIRKPFDPFALSGELAAMFGWSL